MSIGNGTAKVLPVVIVPAAPVLLPRWASLTDPVPDVRAAVQRAVDWLAERCAEIQVMVGDAHGREIAHYLLEERKLTGDGIGLLVVADGTARRNEKAPGHFDERAGAYDASITQALRDGDLAALRGLDVDLGGELLAAGVPTFVELADMVDAVISTHADYADAPFGVQYWVARWECRPARK